MTEGRLEVESKSQECLVIIKREVTSNNLPKRRVLSSTHGVVGGRRLVTASYPIFIPSGPRDNLPASLPHSDKNLICLSATYRVEQIPLLRNQQLFCKSHH